MISTCHSRAENGSRSAGRTDPGKTTILRCIAGTVTPTAGRISVFGHRCRLAGGAAPHRRLPVPGAVLLPAPLRPREPSPLCGRRAAGSTAREQPPAKVARASRRARADGAPVAAHGPLLHRPASAARLRAGAGRRSRPPLLDEPTRSLDTAGDRASVAGRQRPSAGCPGDRDPSRRRRAPAASGAWTSR